MSDHSFPVAIGNVFYMNGEPSQDQLKAMSTALLGDSDLETALDTFSETLLRMGRPGKRSNVISEYGPRITDWLRAGALLRRVPWHSCQWAKALNLPMFELHSHERSGWCAEVSDGVMLHVGFAGNDDGLTSYEMACLLSESQAPNQALIDWLQKLLDDGGDFFIEDVDSHIPKSLTHYLGYHFMTQGRKASMWLGGNASEPLFRASERDRDIERALF